MTTSVMQPYFFPYLGYFQLISASDNFVFYDDVNFIKRGWVNRNRILHKNSDKLVSIPLKKISQNKKINSTYLSDFEKWRTNFIRIITESYKTAPHFECTLNLINTSLEGPFQTISDVNIKSTRSVLDFLDIKTQSHLSSELGGNNYSGQKRIIYLCQSLETTTYLNPINGSSLYEEDCFKAENLDLRFLEPKIVEYDQGIDSFVSHLSIIDVLMFNSKERIKEMLHVHY